MLATASPESSFLTDSGNSSVLRSGIVETETCELLSRLFLWKKEEMPERGPVLVEAGQLVSLSSWLSAAGVL